MRPIVTAKEMKEIELCAIDKIGVPSLVLMERAALSVAERIKQQFDKNSRICVVCGGGNNGADGVCVGRILLEDGYTPVIVVLATPDKFSCEMKQQLEILDKLEYSYEREIPKGNFDCIVDAIFGIGLSRQITDEGILKAIETINLSDAYIYSVDIPSGIHTDTGLVMKAAVKANETVTFTCEKVGLCVFPGKEYAGRITVSQIGIPKVCEDIQKAQHFGMKEKFPKELFRVYPDGNKSTYGKVLVIAGNEEISGAAVLCAKAAMKCGAGMVKVLSCEKTLDVIRNTLPEVMTGVLDEASEIPNVIKKSICWADCVIIGPGIGTDETAYLKLVSVLKEFPENKKLVVDADAINLLASHKELKGLTCKVKNIIYTPHMLELSRLTGKDLDSLKQDLDSAMSTVLEQDEGIYVCKDSVTRVYKKNRGVFINRLGNCGMATAGCGDVLAGIVGAMVAKRGVDAYDGTIYGVHLHSFAGDITARKTGKNGLMAGDIIDSLSDIWKMAEDMSDV